MQNPTQLQSSRLNSASPRAAAASVIIWTSALHNWWEHNKKREQSAGLLLEWSHHLTYKPSDADREFPVGWSKEAQDVTRLSKGYSLLDGPLVPHGVSGTGKGERAGEWGTQHSYEDILLQKWKSQQENGMRASQRGRHWENYRTAGLNTYSRLENKYFHKWAH